MDGDNNRLLQGRVLAEEETRPESGATADAVVTCEDLWSKAQMDVTLLLCNGQDLVPAALARAKRTAGHYAQLYLDDEESTHQGRFYWAGLAAFAAKQVVDGIEHAESMFSSFVGQARLMARVTYYYFLKGNLWVFLEVTPWMFYWREHGDTRFFRCVDRRDVTTYDPVVKEQTESLPWARGENTALRQDLERRMRVLNLSGGWNKLNLSDHIGALAEINECRSTGYLKNGFRKVQEFESSASNARRERAARDGAASFLDHEQRLHLQKMVYDHPEFRFAIDNNDIGRYWWGLLGAQDPELVFNASAKLTPDIIREQLEPMGLSPEEASVKMELSAGKLYDVNDRMSYVENILDQYHWLMTNGKTHRGQFRPYMKRQLQTISGWRNST